MNDREHSIQVSHAGTFTWIFEEKDDDEDNEHVEEYEINENSRDDEHNDMTDDQEDGLSRWDSFTYFLEGENRIYWVQGKAGSGKSCLMKFICDDIRMNERLSK